MHASHANLHSLDSAVVWSLYSYIVTEAIVDLVSQRELVSDPERIQELVRVSAVALFEAADTFDSQSPIEFHDYASMLVHRVIYSTLRLEARHSTLEISAYPK